MTNVKCKGGKEIDLLAINPKTLEKYHVEARVSTTFSLKAKDTYSHRGNYLIPHRDGIDFFHREKFEHKHVKEKIYEIFGEEPYRKILIVWSVEDDSVIPLAKNLNIDVWLMRKLLIELMEKHLSGSRDDVLRLTELMYHSTKDYWKEIYGRKP